MFSQLFVQIFALYKFFRKNLRKKRRKFSMDPIWDKCQIFSSPSFLHFTNISSSNYAIGSHFSEVERKVAIVHLDNDISARQALTWLIDKIF